MFFRVTPCQIFLLELSVIKFSYIQCSNLNQFQFFSRYTKFLSMFLHIWNTLLARYETLPQLVPARSGHLGPGPGGGARGEITQREAILNLKLYFAGQQEGKTQTRKLQFWQTETDQSQHQGEKWNDVICRYHSLNLNIYFFSKKYTKDFPANKCPCWWDLTRNNCACCKVSYWVALNKQDCIQPDS